jgi:acyl carrier protein phosphodiesterase
MNFLAHLYLTRDLSEEIVIGNFIADAVKGKNRYSEYPTAVQIGMDIHREIDSFSDFHPKFKEGAALLYPNYGKYAGIIMDIFYDHILASEWNTYHPQPLNEFAFVQYNLIERHFDLLPEFTKYWFTVMKNDNLLSAYAEESGIDDVLQRMDSRTGNVSGMSGAGQELRAFKNQISADFEILFKDLQEHLKLKFPGLW